MKTLIAAVLAATALAAYAGEDSTERLGSAGTGPAFWQVPGGLPAFARAKAGAPSGQEQAESMMERHEQMMRGMQDEHRAMTGGTGRVEQKGRVASPASDERSSP